MVKTYKDWSEYLLFALWGYRTTTRTTTGQTPFSLVYGCEAVLPIETEIKSLRVVMEARLLRVNGHEKDTITLCLWMRKEWMLCFTLRFTREG